MTPITLRARARPSNLLSVANPLPSGWERGVSFMTDAVKEPDRVNVCSDSAGEPASAGELADFNPVGIRQGVICSALGRPDTVEWVGYAARNTASYALSAELYDGAGTSNPSFADATSIGTVASLQEALALLEGEAEESLFGQLAVIHVPVSLSAYLGDTVYRENNLWKTHAGNLVAIHGVGASVFATGELWAAVGGINTNSYVDRSVNTAESWADLLALIAFDPSFNVSVTLSDSP